MIHISCNFIIVWYTQQMTSKFYVIYNGFNLTVFDGQSNDNEIVYNLNHHRSTNKITYL
jgi:hypothetical protein